MKTIPDILDLAVNAFKNNNLSDADKYFNEARNIDSANPDFSRYYYNIGVILQWQCKYSKAEEFYKKSIEINPNNLEALNNLSAVLYIQGNLSDAKKFCDRVLRIDPNFYFAYNNLGSILRDSSEHLEALTYLRKSIEINPEYTFGNSNYLISMLYCDTLDENDIFSAHENFGNKFNEDKNIKRKKINPSKKIRIGYVSPDFKTHSVAFYFQPIINNFDKNKFEVYCYSDVTNPDPITMTIAQKVSVWIDIHHLDNNTVREKIISDDIDILVDLAGHGNDNRLPVFAQRSAPIQITYLGYPYTTGLKSMDYRLVDEWTDPKGSEKWYTEKLYRIPNGFLTYSPPNNSPEVSIVPPCIKNEYITFGSFNNSAKINNLVIKTWSKLLLSVPKSMLIIKAKIFKDNELSDKYKKRFYSYGVDEKRLIFLSHKENTESHLQTYSQIDIALDTFPYNGTTTTCEALWMGVPVLSLMGNTHRERVGLSLLNQIGLGSIVATSLEDYIKKGIFLANNTDNLQKLRTGLRTAMQQSSLCDNIGFTKRLEDAYINIFNEQTTVNK